MNDNHTINKHLLLLYNELNNAESLSVRLHWNKCEKCRKHYDKLYETKNAYKALPMVSHSDRRLEIALNNAIRKPKTLPERLLHKFSIYKVNWNLAAASLAVMIISVITVIMNTSEMVKPAGKVLSKSDRAFYTEFNPAREVFDDSLRVISSEIYELETGSVKSNQKVIASNVHASVIDGEIENLSDRVKSLSNQLENDEF